MAGDEYMSYLEGMGKFEHHDGDGRTWIYNDLFSYLKPTEYLSKIEKYGFVKLYASVILEERALLFRAKFPDIFSKLEDKVGFENLIITGMTIIFKKDSDSL